MAFVLDKFLFFLDLQLGGIIMAWWGMIASAISIVGVISGLLFGKGNYDTIFPVHVSTGSAVVSGIIAIILLLAYFYFSYQLLLGTQNNNSSQMFGYLIIHGIIAVFFVLGIFKSAFSLIGVILYIYLWFCIYSLYVHVGGSGIV